MGKNRHKPPSRIKYENNHPIVSFRVERSLYDKLKSLLAEKNQSIADFFKIALEEQQDNLNSIYNQGFEKGYDAGKKQGYGQFSLICKKCGKPMVFDIKDPRIGQILTTAFQEWCHTTCIEKPQETQMN